MSRRSLILLSVLAALALLQFSFERGAHAVGLPKLVTPSPDRVTAAEIAQNQILTSEIQKLREKFPALATRINENIIGIDWRFSKTQQANSFGSYILDQQKFTAANDEARAALFLRGSLEFEIIRTRKNLTKVDAERIEKLVEAIQSSGSEHEIKKIVGEDVLLNHPEESWIYQMVVSKEDLLENEMPVMLVSMKKLKLIVSFCHADMTEVAPESLGAQVLLARLANSGHCQPIDNNLYVFSARDIDSLLKKLSEEHIQADLEQNESEISSILSWLSSFKVKGKSGWFQLIASQWIVDDISLFSEKAPIETLINQQFNLVKSMRERDQKIFSKKAPSIPQIKSIEIVSLPLTNVIETSRNELRQLVDKGLLGSVEVRKN